MDHILGIVGSDFVIVATDNKVAHSVLAIKTDQDKILQLDSHKVIAAGGEFGDVVQFTEYIKKNMQLYNLRNGYTLTTKAAAHFTRGEIARLLRSNPHQCNMLLAGWDAQAGPQLFWIDYLGAMQQLNCGAHGYGYPFAVCISVLTFFPRYQRLLLSRFDGQILSQGDES